MKMQVLFFVFLMTGRLKGTVSSHRSLVGTDRPRVYVLVWDRGVDPLLLDAPHQKLGLGFGMGKSLSEVVLSWLLKASKF